MMTVPILALLFFALWTLLTLLGTVGIYRWSRILTGRARLSEFRADRPEGSDLYRRAMRAHANCIENLPVFGAIVLAAHVARLQSWTLDVLAVVFLIARILQTVTHVAFEETDAAVGVRFSFFLVQIVSMLCMGVWILTHAW